MTEEGLGALKRRAQQSQDWKTAWVDAALPGTELLAEGGGGAGAARQLLFVTGAKHDYVHPVHAAGAAPYQPALRCDCGSPNPDGVCTAGRLTKPFAPTSATQLQFLREGWQGAGADARAPWALPALPPDSTAELLALRAGAPHRR
jgi:hypothetical protein